MAESAHCDDFADVVIEYGVYVLGQVADLACEYFPGDFVQ